MQINNEFLYYSYHTQELEDIVDKIAIQQGVIESNNLTHDDIEYIQNRVKEKYGINVKIYSK